MNPIDSIIVPTDTKPQRLDIFLAEYLKITRSQVQKKIEANEIFVNGTLPKKAGDTIHAGDKISPVSSTKKSPTVARPTKTTTTVTPKDLKPTFVATTTEYVVIDKPSGLLTHPTMAHEKTTLVSFLVKKYPSIKLVGENDLRPGIVHRLDKEASGLLVAARTEKMFKHLKEQFKNRTVSKEYLVLVHGRTSKEEDTINFPLARSENEDRMAARPRTKINADGNAAALLPGEKEALTEFVVEKYFVNFTLLRVRLHTGRMHQIRAHLFAYNHPVVGDPLYIQKKRKRTWDERLGRLFLHCTNLGFNDLKGEKQTFNSPLPKELAEFLNTLAPQPTNS